MNKAMQVNTPYSFPDIHSFFVSTQDIQPKAERDHLASINNYLKSPEEIEAELCLEMNNRKQVFLEHKQLMDSYGRIFKNRSDNAYSPDNNPSGFMEENY